MYKVQCKLLENGHVRWKMPWSGKNNFLLTSRARMVYRTVFIAAFKIIACDVVVPSTHYSLCISLYDIESARAMLFTSCQLYILAIM